MNIVKPANQNYFLGVFKYYTHSYTLILTMSIDVVDKSETGNWNVAQIYSVTKLMKWLFLIDEYNTMARMGVSKVLEEFITVGEQKTSTRVLGLKWMNHALLRIIDNNLFAIKEEKDRIKLETFREKLKQIRKLLPNSSTTKTNIITKMEDTVIHEKLFNSLLEEMEDIARIINTPLNRSDLIYRFVEQFDEKTFKGKLHEELIGA